LTILNNVSGRADYLSIMWTTCVSSAKSSWITSWCLSTYSDLRSYWTIHSHICRILFKWIYDYRICFLQYFVYSYITNLLLRNRLTNRSTDWISN
jgi:hypothetical protein